HKYYEINELLNETSNNEQLINDYLRKMKTEDLIQYKVSVESEKHLFNEVERNTDSLDTYLQVNAIKNAMNAYFYECNKAREMRIRKDENYYLAQNKAIHINAYMKSYIQKLLSITLKEGRWNFTHRLTPKINNIKMITLGSLLLISALCFGFASIFSIYLSKPIHKLADAALKMSNGNLDIKKIVVKAKDDIGILADSFNKMNISLKLFVEDLTEKSILAQKLHEEELKNIEMQHLLKEVEFQALQSQVNPHFLFNTLNVIAHTAMFENAEKTKKLIQSLAALFRYSLDKKNKETTLEKELQITMEYINIQQYRFGDRIKIEIMCNTAIDSVFIPRFTLQPLVENSVIHGLEPKGDGGTLRIKIFRKSQNVVIKIIDNGVGIARNELKKLLNYEAINSTGQSTSIGIANVMGRLNYYFNGEAVFKITSKIGKGTVISIALPTGKEVVNHV
ncbi:MAG TPA: hypothetical protein DDW50_06130, partial [Firmicutes bacterium]|nr:hypothetical protein [Bacillota bacterium]